MTTAKPARITAATRIAQQKAEIAYLITALQRAVAAVPNDGDFGSVGDLGHINEQLTDLVRTHLPKGPVLNQTEMTIWFDRRTARNAVKATVAAKAPRGVRVASVDSDKGWGLLIEAANGADDAATDEAIDLLMETAVELEGCTIVSE